ncbi:UNVERIFIED_CONTAM: FCS-Like Zinc finger 5 [Sesamum calycinum]|uniref:FCS-Like Zinc finger 5 n=1 Tax=Sesamum calycinum TaxID=2727403 RepID=A0AAW2P899_9LAMI
MSLGKSARPPMKRTTSMTEFTLDFYGSAEAVYQPLDPHNPFNGGGAAGGLDQRFSGSSAASAAASPRPSRPNSADFVGTAHFLRVCSLCKRRLIPGRDIYMYSQLKELSNSIRHSAIDLVFNSIRVYNLQPPKRKAREPDGGRKKKKGKVTTATASTEGAPAAASGKDKRKGKVGGSQRSKTNDDCMHCQGKEHWKREYPQLLSNPNPSTLV